MNAAVTVALACLGGLVLVGLMLASAWRSSRTPDLIEYALEALDADVRAGRITERARAAQRAALLAHLEIVVSMQQLIDHADAHLVSADLIPTAGAPELRIETTSGNLHDWIDALRRTDMREVGITDHGYVFRGRYTVRISNHRIEPAEIAA